MMHNQHLHGAIKWGISFNYIFKQRSVLMAIIFLSFFSQDHSFEVTNKNVPCCAVWGCQIADHMISGLNLSCFSLFFLENLEAKSGTI